MCYVRAKRGDYAAKYPEMTFGELSKKIAEAWKELSKNDKTPYEDEHTREKARYEEQMKNYVPPESDSESEDSEEKTKKPRKRAKKDPNAPKKATNAYLYYTKDNREKVKKELPKLQGTEVTKELSARWKKMTKEDKVPYEKQAKEDKARYEKEKEEYDNK